jgi:hypothetical protein
MTAPYGPIAGENTSLTVVPSLRTSIAFWEAENGGGESIVGDYLSTTSLVV